LLSDQLAACYQKTAGSRQRNQKRTAETTHGRDAIGLHVSLLFGITQCLMNERTTIVNLCKRWIQSNRFGAVKMCAPVIADGKVSSSSVVEQVGQCRIQPQGVVAMANALIRISQT
jgi:hypothetical protein